MRAWQVDYTPNTPEWTAWRRDGVGGSDIPTVLGKSPYPDATIRRLALDKLGLITEPRLENYAMRRGHLLEPRARKLFAERLDVEVYVACVEHLERRHHRVSLDGWFRRRDEIHIIEIKCLDHEQHLLFGRVYDKVEPVSALPLHLLLQCQWQLYVSGADCCHLCNFSIKRGEERPLHCIRLYPEPILWAGYMIPCVDAFWSNIECIRAGFMTVDDLYPEEKETAE